MGKDIFNDSLRFEKCCLKEKKTIFHLVIFIETQVFLTAFIVLFLSK